MRIRRSSLQLTFAISLIVLVVSGCGSGGGDPPAASIGGDSTKASDAASQSGSTVTEPVQVRAGVASSNTPAQPPQAAARDPEVILKTSLGDIRLRLNAEKAPLTVDNFLSNYVERGFYEGTVFHYVDNGFMVAGGGYTTELEPKATRAYVKNESSNGLKNKRGTIAMARNPDQSSAKWSRGWTSSSELRKWRWRTAANSPKRRSPRSSSKRRNGSGSPPSRPRSGRKTVTKTRASLPEQDGYAILQWQQEVGPCLPRCFSSSGVRRAADDFASASSTWERRFSAGIAEERWSPAIRRPVPREAIRSGP